MSISGTSGRKRDIRSTMRNSTIGKVRNGKKISLITRVLHLEELSKGRMTTLQQMLIS